MEKLELRMYSLVLYQLSNIQKGIQTGHSNDEYGNFTEETNHKEYERYLDWRRNHKTVIILNGGSSSSLTEHIQMLVSNKVPNVYFEEPDLYNQITAVSFLVDERVFNKNKYPDNFLFETYQNQFKEILKKKAQTIDLSYLAILEEEENQLKIEAKPVFDAWTDYVGGSQNVFLRNWLKNFKLA